jgi:hypothetical protein
LKGLAQRMVVFFSGAAVGAVPAQPQTQLQAAANITRTMILEPFMAPSFQADLIFSSP